MTTTIPNSSTNVLDFSHSPSLSPKRIFIVPYRNRIQQKFFFSKQMDFILEDSTDYEIYFVHQCDTRNFNRGATKNIGFLAMKQKYPDNYKDITFIFNDVDTLPFHKIFDYETTQSVVKHYYGFETALGGILAIKGSDFEKINGYPNYWGWGMEDACLQKRCLAYNLKIDRSHFYPIGSPEILQLFDGVARLVSRKDPLRMKSDKGIDGLKTIHKLAFTVDKESLNPADNKYVVNNERIMVINVATFLTQVSANADKFHEYDLREPVSKVMFPERDREIAEKTMINTDEWKNIPYYPTPTPTPSVNVSGFQTPSAIASSVSSLPSAFGYGSLQSRQINEERKIDPRNYIQQQQQQQRQQQQQQPINVYAAEYARRLGIPPRATSSANIGLGGVRR